MYIVHQRYYLNVAASTVDKNYVRLRTGIFNWRPASPFRNFPEPFKVLKK